MSESYTNSHEEIPSLPEGPQEAAQALEELWRNRGKWPKSKPLEEMTDEERQQEIEKHSDHNQQFGWFTEMFRSELLWDYAKVETNYGTAHCFRFWPQHDTKEDEVLPPNVYVFNLNTGSKMDNARVFYRNSNKQWEERSLQSFYDEYNESSSLLVPKTIRI